MDLAKCIKILTPKQMSHGLPIALTQFKAGDTSKKNLQNKITQIQYFMYKKKKKKRNTNNTPNSIKL